MIQPEHRETELPSHAGVDVPIVLDVDIPVNERIPVTTEIPVVLSVPLSVDVEGTELARLAESLQAGLASFKAVMAGLAG